MRSERGGLRADQVLVGLGVGFFMVISSSLMVAASPIDFQEEWVAAVRGLEIRGERDPADINVSRAQPP